MVNLIGSNNMAGYPQETNGNHNGNSTASTSFIATAGQPLSERMIWTEAFIKGHFFSDNKS